MPEAEVRVKVDWPEARFLQGREYPYPLPPWLYAALREAARRRKPGQVTTRRLICPWCGAWRVRARFYRCAMAHEGGGESALWPGTLEAQVECAACGWRTVLEVFDWWAGPR